jgi:hypothetical protein
MATHDAPSVSLGDGIFTEDGSRIGTIRGFDDNGFYVTLRDGVDAPHPQSRSTTGQVGEINLMWRCWQCGETDEIEGMPDSCPSCGAPAEDLYYWTED